MISILRLQQFLHVLSLFITRADTAGEHQWCFEPLLLLFSLKLWQKTSLGILLGPELANSSVLHEILTVAHVETCC